MSMNSSNFPLVWMNLSQEPGHDNQKDFDEFEANLQRGEPFVILSDTAPSEDHEHTPGDRKRTTLWMKKHKDALRRLVLAMILIEPNQAKRLAFKAFSVVFAKFWGYPLLLASSHEQAIEMATELLSANEESSR
ncbi:hypothetical protein [Acidovorax sacchari]|uniref:hypothetical protein n=1 Tax=Acidovorax sacchari TaxID=3230736 RepID=UPI0039E3D336